MGGGHLASWPSSWEAAREMTIFLIGEAGNHAAKLAEALGSGEKIVPLPVEAAFTDAHDAMIGRDDIIVSLRLKRPNGTAPAVGLIHVPGAGLDGIDFDRLADRTIVCNVFEHEIPIAEFVLSQMLEWEIGAQAMRRSFSPDNWSQIYRKRVPHGEIHGKTLGVLGFGRIGRAIGSRARALGMQVVAVDAHATSAAEADICLAPDQLQRMLREADYIAISCPLTQQTRGLIGQDELASMKPDAVLMNVSRAEIVDEAALYRALEQKQIGGAVLDVWYAYPTGADDVVAPSNFPFHTLENAVCTPHSSAWTTALPYRRYRKIAENIRRFRAGEPLMNVVREGAPQTTPA